MKTFFQLRESSKLDEMKMNDPKLLKVFDKLKKGSTVKLKTSSTISKGKDFVEYIVKSKNTVNKGRVEKITLATVGNEGAVKKFLYKRDGTVGFAIGDMGASIDDIKEAKKGGKIKSMSAGTQYDEDYQVQKYTNGKKDGAAKSFGGNLKKATAHADKMGGDHRVHKVTIDRPDRLTSLRVSKDKPPFNNPKPIQKNTKDKFGNPIKNRARYLARKAARDLLNKAK
jgi:hypothetical protein